MNHLVLIKSLQCWTLNAHWVVHQCASITKVAHDSVVQHANEYACYMFLLVHIACAYTCILIGSGEGVLCTIGFCGLHSQQITGVMLMWSLWPEYLGSSVEIKVQFSFGNCSLVQLCSRLKFIS